jgi:hypothetical protein
MKPLCELSLIVAVSSGPGIIAPENAMIKEETKIVISSHTVYMSPIPKNIESSETFTLIISFPAGPRSPCYMRRYFPIRDDPADGRQTFFESTDLLY